MDSLKRILLLALVLCLGVLAGFAMIWPDEAILVSPPKFEHPSPKMVGNINDMHPETQTKAITPSIPPIKMMHATAATANMEATSSREEALKHFIRPVNTHRMQANRTKAQV